MLKTATSAHIPAIMEVRLAVRENRLSNPDLVTAADCEDHIHHRGRGWIYEVGGQLAGFAIVDLVDHNVWALFLHPDHEGKGIGKILHHAMIDWYFEQTEEKIWLGTAPGTRAEGFYRKFGWTDLGTRANGEVYFEMTAAGWKNQQTKNTRS